MNGNEVIFKSKQCYARLFNDSDIDDFMTYRNDLKWMTHQGFKGLTRKEFEKALLRKSSFDEGIQLAVTRKSDDKIIGDLYIKKDGSYYWIGYTINPAYKRKGYTSGIVGAMVEWIMDQGGLRVLAEMDSNNIPSIRLIEKAGFTKLKEDRETVIYARDCMRREL